MHHCVGDVEHERFLWIAFFFEEIDRLVGVERGQASHVFGAAGLVVVLVEVHRAAIIGTERAEVVVEALCVGHAIDDGLAVRDVPLANAGGLVDDIADEFGKSDLASRHAPAFATDRLSSG